VVGKQQPGHLQAVLDLQPVGGDLLLPQFDAQQVIRRDKPCIDRKGDLTVYFVELPLDGFDGPELLLERDDLPEIGIRLLADLRLGLPHLKRPDLLAHAGELVAVDDLQTRKEGLHGHNAAEHAALDQRQGHLHRPHLRDRQSEISLHQPVLGLKGSARGGDLRKVVREGLAAVLTRRLEIEAAVAQRAVVFDGRRAALLKRQGLGPSRACAEHPGNEKQLDEGLFHHL